MPIAFECPTCKRRVGRAAWLQDHMLNKHGVSITIAELYMQGCKKNVAPAEEIKFDLPEDKS